jgi:hypothetical protein
MRQPAVAQPLEEATHSPQCMDIPLLLPTHAPPPQTLCDRACPPWCQQQTPPAVQPGSHANTGSSRATTGLKTLPSGEGSIAASAATVTVRHPTTEYVVLQLAYSSAHLLSYAAGCD